MKVRDLNFMKMRCRIFGFCCLAYVLMIFATQSVSAEVSGWLDTVHSVRTASPHDKITSRARLRLEARADLNWLYGFSSVDAEKNWIISEETGVDAQEFWVEHVADTWDIRMGRQIIIWGQADGDHHLGPGRRGTDHGHDFSAGSDRIHNP